MNDDTYATSGEPTAADPPGYSSGQSETAWEENRVNPSAQPYYYGDPTYPQGAGRTGNTNNPPGYTWRQGRWAQSYQADSRNDPNFETLDMDKRDPNELNPHITYKFNEVIGEPDGAHSADCVWQNSFTCFHLGANCCYMFLTYLCAIPAAFCWGCQFACLTFNHIWCVTPYIRAFNVNFYCTARLFSSIVHCLCDPLYDSASLLFTKIFVNKADNAQPYRTRPIEEINLLLQSPVHSTTRSARNSAAVS